MRKKLHEQKEQELVQKAHDHIHADHGKHVSMRKIRKQVKNKNNRKMEEIENLQTLEEKEKVLFEGRKQPLTVEKVSEDGAIIQGPNGGEYKIYSEEDAKHFLIAKPGNERYSSYCKNLRKIGEWEKLDEKTWQHTDTDAEISIIKNQAGFWTLKVEKLEENLDLPKYGFSDLENAREEAEKLVENNPEG